MNRNLAIKVENLTKEFKLPHEKYTTAKQKFVNIVRRPKVEKLKALDKISFEIKKGEFFGIIGANGSGKSTLLKILAQIYLPTAGNVEVRGKVSPFIELGVGFNPELTARENVFLNGAILGLSKEETEDKFDEIIRFAELEQFVDQKLKNFSSGMQVRLAFSIAIQAQAEILLVDEVLAVGDAAFQQKCFDIFRKLKDKGTTVIFVSHALNVIEEFCDRTFLLDSGKVGVLGQTREVIRKYQAKSLINRIAEVKKMGNGERRGSGEVLLTASEVLDKQSKNKMEILQTGNDYLIRLHYKIVKPVKKLNFALGFYRSNGVQCFVLNTQHDYFRVRNKLKTHGFIDLEIRKIPFNKGEYYYNAEVFGEVEEKPYDWEGRFGRFVVENGLPSYSGLIIIDHKWIDDQAKK